MPEVFAKEPPQHLHGNDPVACLQKLGLDHLAARKVQGQAVTHQVFGRGHHRMGGFTSAARAKRSASSFLPGVLVAQWVERRRPKKNPASSFFLAAYVDMTRSRTRQKILIYRPFLLAPFQQGVPLGPQLLLDVWKQEPVDWDAL